MLTLEQQVIKTFQYLHSHPEISWQEIKTTSLMKSILEQNGCKTETFDDCTGVIGYYGNFNGDPPIIGIRADMDALWQEVNGTFQANHSCGHDAHMAMVLGVLWKLQQQQNLKDRLAVKFIFQPAEEVGRGALKMVEKHVADDLDFLFGIHLRPNEETKMGHASPAIVHGASANIDGKIIGEDAHGARPHLNQNAIEIGAQLVQMLNQIHLNPNTPYSAKLTAFHAGGKSTNIIPGNATFSIDLRAQKNEVMDELLSRVNKVFDYLQNFYDVKIEMISEDRVPAAVTNDEAIAIMEKSIIKTVGHENLDPPIITPGGDDFHYYSVKKPEIKATMLGLGCDLQPGLHHPSMNFNKDALINGVNILYRAILQTNNIENE